MPGEEVEDALEAAEQFRPLGIALLFTHLGENLERAEQAQAVADHYHDLLAKIMARGLDAEISVKPTQLGLDLDADATLVHLKSLATHAAEAKGSLWLDMEGSAYTQATIDLYRRAQGRSSRRRHLPAGVPAAHANRRERAAAAQAADPTGQGRV